MKEVFNSWHGFTKYLDTYTASISRVLTLVGGIVCGLTMLTIVVIVLSRFLFNYPIQGAMPAVIIGAPLMFALGISYAQVNHAHIRVNIIASNLKQGPRRILEVAVLVISTLLLALLTWLVAGNAIESWLLNQYEPGLVRIPIYPTKIIVACSLALLCLRNFVELLRWFGPRPIERR